MNLCKKRKIDTFHLTDLTAIPSLMEVKHPPKMLMLPIVWGSQIVMTQYKNFTPNKLKRKNICILQGWIGLFFSEINREFTSNQSCAS